MSFCKRNPNINFIVSDTTTTPADSNHPHSIYGASCASRWRGCPGSVRVIETAKLLGDIPEDDSSSYAEEGTEAHDWADKLLQFKCEAADIPDEMREAVVAYVEFCRAIVSNMAAEDEDGKPQVFHEQALPLFYRPEEKGTTDFAALSKSRLKVADYKHGAGVKVEADQNDQLTIYAMNLIRKLEAEQGAFNEDFPVSLHIFQPRHFSFDGPDTWETTVGELRDIAIDIEADYQIAKEGNGPVKASVYACQFCPARGVCEVRANTHLEGLPGGINPLEEFDDETAADTIKAHRKDPEGTMNADQIGFICKHGPAIKKLVDDVIDGERARIEAGGELRGMKLVAGKAGARKWTDEAAAEKLIKQKLGTAETYKARQVITAPQALAKLKPMMGDLSTRFKNKLDSLIHQTENKPKLVPIDADGETLEFKTAAEEFDDESIDDDAASML